MINVAVEFPGRLSTPNLCYITLAFMQNIIKEDTFVSHCREYGYVWMMTDGAPLCFG